MEAISYYEDGIKVETKGYKTGEKIMKKHEKFFIFMRIAIIVLIILFVIVYDCFLCEIIRVHYVCEVPFDTEIYDVLDRAKYCGPRMRSYKSDDSLLYENYLDDIFKGARLSDSKIQDIKNQISGVSDNNYIYVVVGKKLKYVRHSKNFEYDGAYSYEDYNSVFIYWAKEPLGNGVDCCF